MKTARVLLALLLAASFAIAPAASAVEAVDRALEPGFVSAIAKAVKPKSIQIVAPPKRMALDKVVKLKCVVKPLRAPSDVMWYTSNTVAEVSDDGTVTPKRVGKVMITARAKARLAVKDTFTLEVYDPEMPEKISITPNTVVLQPGQTKQLSVTATPATAKNDVDWYSSDPETVEVSPDGVVNAVSYGRATITAVAQNGGAKATAMAVVLMPTVDTDIPKRTTFRDLASVKENLEKIDGILSSAIGEVARLSESGLINQAERTMRIRILSNAFDMYRFPWYTDERVRYWTSDYHGQKDFYPGNVYFGLPYIQSGFTGSRVNRRFNVNKAVSQAFYVKRNDGVYKMSAKRLDGSYVGNDCSAFVGAATFVGNGYGIGSGVCFMLTSSIVTSSMYRTVPSFDMLRPGDVIVRGHDHAVMFLYYVDSAKTRMMIIEQGGGTAADMHNTVACSIVNRSRYESKFKIRRARFLAL